MNSEKTIGQRIEEEAQKIYDRERKMNEEFFIKREAEKIAKRKLYERDYEEYLTGLRGPRPSLMDRITGKRMTLDEYIDWREDVYY